MGEFDFWSSREDIVEACPATSQTILDRLLQLSEPCQAAVGEFTSSQHTTSVIAGFAGGKQSIDMFGNLEKIKNLEDSNFQQVRKCGPGKTFTVTLRVWHKTKPGRRQYQYVQYRMRQFSVFKGLWYAEDGMVKMGFSQWPKVTLTWNQSSKEFQSHPHRTRRPVVNHKTMSLEIDVYRKLHTGSEHDTEVKVLGVELD